MTAKRVIFKWTEQYWENIFKNTACFAGIPFIKNGFYEWYWYYDDCPCPSSGETLHLTREYPRLLSPFITDYPSYPGYPTRVRMDYHIVFYNPKEDRIRRAGVGRITAEVARGLAEADCISFFLDEYPYYWNPYPPPFMLNLHIESEEGYDLCDNVPCEPCCACCE